MRIVFNTYFKEGTGGGMGQIVYEMVQVFAEKHQVLFVVPGDKTGIRKAGNLTYLEIKSVGDDQIILPKLSLKTTKYLGNNLSKFRPDIIHAHDPGIIGFFLQNWAIKNNAPFVYTSHVLPTKFVEFGSQEAQKKLSEFFDKFIIRKYLKLFFDNCSGVVALNAPAKKDIKKLGYSGKIFEISNGRHLKNYNQLPFADISSLIKKLLFIGYFSFRKNQQFLLKVMTRLPKNFQLDLIGVPLQEKYKEELISFAKKYKLNVNFLGRIDHRQIPEFLQKAHFFVSSSKMEVQSLVVMEAMASGTPVVGLSNETMDQFVNEKNGFNFPKRTSPKIFADKILKLSNLSQKDYKKLCVNARKKMETYDWVKIREQTEKMYQAIIGEKKNDREVKKRNLANFFDELILRLDKGKGKAPKDIIKGFNTRDLYVLLLSTAIFVVVSWYSFNKKFKRIWLKFNLSSWFIK